MWWHKVVAVVTFTHCNNSAQIPLPQVGVAVHHYLLIGGGGREGSVSWDGGYVHIGHVTNTPGDSICCVILTAEGDVASSAHIRGIWVGLSEGDSTCTMGISKCSSIAKDHQLITQINTVLVYRPFAHDVI